MYKNDIIQKIVQQIEEYNHNISQNDIEEYKVSDEEIATLQGLQQYMDEEILDNNGNKLELPASILDYYRDYSDKLHFNLYGDVWMLPIKDIIVENIERAPGALSIKYGVITIGVTTGGNAVSLDLNNITNGEPRILYMDHSIFNSNVVYYPGLEMKSEPLSYKVIDELSTEVSSTFWSFLEMMSNKEIEDIELLYNC